MKAVITQLRHTKIHKRHAVSVSLPW